MQPPVVCPLKKHRAAPAKGRRQVRVAALLAVSELCSAERCRTRKAHGLKRSELRVQAVRQVALLFADEEEEVQRFEPSSGPCEVRFTAQKVMCSIGWERRRLGTPSSQASARRCAVDALAKLLENPQEEAGAQGPCRVASREQVRLLAARTFKRWGTQRWWRVAAASIGVAGAQKPRAMKRAMRLVRRSTTAGVRAGVLLLGWMDRCPLEPYSASCYPLKVWKHLELWLKHIMQQAYWKAAHESEDIARHGP